jgi:HK97 family phage prohead protease
MNKNDKNLIKYKSLKIDSPNVDETTMTVSGYLAAFNNVDSAGDRLLKGCFSKSLKEHGTGSTSDRKIIFCWQHDMSKPLGQFTNLYEDEKGLYFEAKLDDIPFVREVVIPQYKSGTLNQHSIGYRYIFDKCQWKEDKELGDVFEVGEVELFEGSVVTAGCNENTPFMGFKNLTQQEIEDSNKKLDELTAKLSSFDRIKIKQFVNSLLFADKSTADVQPPSLEEKPNEKISVFKLKKSKNE